MQKSSFVIQESSRLIQIHHFYCKIHHFQCKISPCVNLPSTSEMPYKVAVCVTNDEFCIKNDELTMLRPSRIRYKIQYKFIVFSTNSSIKSKESVSFSTPSFTAAAFVNTLKFRPSKYTRRTSSPPPARSIAATCHKRS